jgi:hypothetical protein
VRSTYFDINGDNKESEGEEGLKFQTSNFTLQTSIWQVLNDGVRLKGWML